MTGFNTTKVFDKDKIEKYIEFMEDNGVLEITFSCGCILLINNVHKDFDLYNTKTKEAIYNHESIDDFKKEVIKGWK